MSSNSSPIVGVIITTPPTLDSEASELALALAAFDMPIKLIFTGLGISWLVPQEARKENGKSASKVLAALPMYGVDEVYYSTEDATKLLFSNLSLPKFSQALTTEELQQQIAQCAHCVTF